MGRRRKGPRLAFQNYLPCQEQDSWIAQKTVNGGFGRLNC